MTGYARKDTSLKVTKALPNGAASTTSDGIDLGLTTRSDFTAPCELLLTAPAMATGVMGDAKTMIYSIEMDDNSSFSSATSIATILTQTGAGGAGCSAATARYKLPSNVERYVRVKATGSTTGNASTSSMTLELLV